MVSHPARIAQICNLDGDDFNSIVGLLQLLGLDCVRAAQIHIRNVIGEDFAASVVSSELSEALANGVGQTYAVFSRSFCAPASFVASPPSALIPRLSSIDFG